MNSITEYLAFNILSRRGFVNITSEIEKIVQKSGIKERSMLTKCNAHNI